VVWLLLINSISLLEINTSMIFKFLLRFKALIKFIIVFNWLLIIFI
jgi:hypothetical protein